MEIKKASIITRIKKIHNDIEMAIEHNNINKANERLLELSNIAKTEKYYVAKSTIEFNQQLMNEGYKTILTGLSKFPFSFDLHFNGSIAAYVLGKYDLAFYHIGKSLKFTNDAESKEAASKNLTDLVQSLQLNSHLSKFDIQQYVMLVERISKEVDPRVYPIDTFGESLIRKVQKKGTPSENLTNLYKPFLLSDIDNNTRYLTKTEMLQGSEYMHKQYDLKGKTSIPLSYINEEVDIHITHNGEKLLYKKGVLDSRQYNYLTFDTGQVEIKVDSPIFIGTPVPLQNVAKQPKLILHIFVDALSQQYLEEHSLSTLMPNTAEFFNKGYINENTWSCAEWTLPSLASIVTGKEITNHGLHHPNYPYDLSKDNTLLITTLKEQGYYTTHFNNDWRSVPNYGYDEAFNRVVYQNALGGFEASQIIGEAIEHIHTLKESNQYVWLTLTDLHDVPDEIHKNYSGQVNLNAKHRTKSKKGVTSVQTRYDEEKVVRYKTEIERMDLHLSTLFNYLEANFKQEEYIVILNSDHGQSYLVDSDFYFMHGYRRKVPLMYRGYKIPRKVSKELMSGTDIYPSLFSLLDLPVEGIDGRVSKDFGGGGRDVAITESHHPGQSYKAALQTDNYIIYYETMDTISDFNEIDLEEYKSTVEAGEDVVWNEALQDEADKLLNEFIKRKAFLQR